MPRSRHCASDLRAVAGDAVLVGGPSAEEADVRAATKRDTKLLVPLVLLVVFAILVVLLRAIVAPVMLMATVVLSFFAAIGLSLLVFDAFASFPGEDPSYALFSFIFLVALGVDYNIFLMARVREEAHRMPTRDAMLTSLAVTGGVITSAGRRPRRHVRRARGAAARRAHPARDHRRARRPPRHARRALDPRARAHVRARRADVVAGALPADGAPQGAAGPRRTPASASTRFATPRQPR